MVGEYSGGTPLRDDLAFVVVKAALDCLRQLRRMSEGSAVPAIACYRDDSLESIVRCAGSKFGYV